MTVSMQGLADLHWWDAPGPSWPLLSQWYHREAPLSCGHVYRTFFPIDLTHSNATYEGWPEVPFFLSNCFEANFAPDVRCVRERSSVERQATTQQIPQPPRESHGALGHHIDIPCHSHPLGEEEGRLPHWRRPGGHEWRLEWQEHPLGPGLSSCHSSFASKIFSCKKESLLAAAWWRDATSRLSWCQSHLHHAVIAVHILRDGFSYGPEGMFLCPVPK